MNAIGQIAQTFWIDNTDKSYYNCVNVVVNVGVIVYLWSSFIRLMSRFEM